MKNLFSIIFIFVFSFAVFGSTFTVNSSGDSNDADTSDNLCLDSQGKCTLRAAIQQANAATGKDTIAFGFNTPTIINLTIGQLSITSSITITGTGARSLAVQRSEATGTADFRIFDIALTGNSSVSIRGITIANGNITGNNYGGGIRSSCNSLSSISLTEVSIENNTAQEGGGIFNNCSLKITRSTISNNMANFQGGGINNNSTLDITNSTISDNMTNGFGGGIYQTSSGTTSLQNATISNNTADENGGGIISGGGFYTQNSIIAGNNAPANPDGYFIFALSLGNNLIGIQGSMSPFTNGENGDKIGTSASPIDPKLGPLQNNGGETDTRAILAGSPAIDSGNNCVVVVTCSSDPLVTDQRGEGFPRLLDGNNDDVLLVDIGAFEFELVCDFSINPTSRQFSGMGGNTTVNVTTPSGCIWTAKSNADWISLSSGASGNGNGTVTLSVQANTGDARTGTVTIAGETFTVNQSAACSFTVDVAPRNFTFSGGVGQATVTTQEGCTWSAASSDSWITIAASAGGSSSETFDFTVAANTGVARTGTITIAGQTFTISQAVGVKKRLRIGLP